MNTSTLEPLITEPLRGDLPTDVSPFAPLSHLEQARLRELADNVQRLAAKDGVDLQPVALARLFDGTLLYNEHGSRPLMFADADHDPMFLAGHGIPAANRAAINKAARSGYNFPNVYILHELPPSAFHRGDIAAPKTLRWVDRDEARQLLPPAPPSPATSRTAEHLGRGAELATATARKLVTGFGLALGAIVAAPIAAGVVTTAAVGGLLLASALDPVVLGALTLPGAGGTTGTPAVFFVVTQWEW